MKPLHKYISSLLLINILIAGTGYLLILYGFSGFTLKEIILLASLFTVITFIALVIFIRGQNKDPGSQTMHTMVSVSLKFLLELILALVWFFIAKKTSPQSVVMFFVIYLTLTLFLIWVILKTLKNKSL